MEPEQDIPPTQEQEEAVEPTRSVKNFWERLDEVFTQNTDLRDRLNEIVDQFPTEAAPSSAYRSFVFQPERISVTSNEDAEPSINPAELYGSLEQQAGHQPAETFSQFRVRFQKSLINVKSLQLLSCVIPNATTNIPDYQTTFFYYRIRSVALANKGAWNSSTLYTAGDIVTFLGNTFAALQNNSNYQPVGVQIGVWWTGPITLPVDTTRPNYFDLNGEKLFYFSLLPTQGLPPESQVALNESGFNRTFQDYQDLVTGLNTALQIPQQPTPSANDISFVYNQTVNRIQMVPNATNIAAGYYYMPAGYEDPNVVAALSAVPDLIPEGSYKPGYTLNLRLGFTWNGLFPNPAAFSNPWVQTPLINALYWYLRPCDPAIVSVSTEAWNRQIITANSYPDLVNTSCVKVYCDLTAGSTEEGQILGQQQQSGLLSIVPVNTTNLGVGFYQNNFNNPLTKVPRIISELQIRLVNDQGQPFVLPNSATVLLELGITYH